MAIANGQALLLKALVALDIWGGINTVCELGSQDPIPDELTTLFDSFNKQVLNGKYGAKELYEYLGVSEYSSIDFNGLYNAHSFDLNNNLKSTYDYHETFDMVTNFGTANVVFNQFELFRNIHNLCKKDGYMIHTFPSKGWGNQWFYRYDSRMVEDLAAANDYQILFLQPFLRFRPYLKESNADSLQQIRRLCDFIESTISKLNKLNSDHEKVNPDLFAQQEIEKCKDSLHALQRIGKEDALFNISLACILKKNSSEEFKTPILNIYE